MRLGIDIDDTICDTWQYVMPYMAKYYDVDLDYLKKINKVYEEALNIDFDEYFRFAKKFYGSIIPTVPLKKDVVEVLTNLRSLGVEIIFITARSSNGFDDPYKISYDYLTSHNVPFDKLIVGNKNKGEVCKGENIDLFIDDSINNCRCVKKEGIDVLLFESVSNRDNNEFTKVGNWKQVEKIIMERR